VAAIAANQELAQSVGVKTILKMYEKAAILAGADKDFKLRPDQKAQVNELQKMAQQIQIACAKHTEDTIAKPVAENMAKMQQEIKTLDQAMAKLIATIHPPTQPPVQPGPPPNATPSPAQPVVSGPSAAPVVVPPPGGM